MRLQGFVGAIGAVLFVWPALAGPFDRWTYIALDSSRPGRAFGLAAADLDRDGDLEVVSGPFLYRNPGGPMTKPWERIRIGPDLDGMLVLDVDNDARPDLIAEALPDVYWCEADDPDAERWTSRRVAKLPPTSHRNGQGYRAADLLGDHRAEILLSAGDGTYLLHIPDRPETVPWPTLRLTTESTEEGLAVADFDRDGDLDVAVPLRDNGLGWLENPGRWESPWQLHHVGRTPTTPDRLLAGDLDGNGLPDLVVTTETRLDGAGVFWFRQPPTPDLSWPRFTIARQFTTNSADLADMDHDGDLDLITAEHRGSKKLQIWENRNRGSRWVEHVIDRGRENHLGAQVADLDGDGDLDLIGIGWDAYQYLHLWRNDSIRLAQEAQ